MSQRRRGQRRRHGRKRRRSSCLSWPVILGVALLLLYTFWARPQLSEYAGEQISTQLGLPVDVPVGVADPAQQQQLEGRVEQGQQVLPTALAALPSGELRLTEDQANAYFAANQQALEPIERLRVQFVPGQVIADVRVFGVDARVTSELAVRDGRLVVTNPRLDGALGLLISLEDLVRPVEQQINNQLVAQGQTIRDGRVEQGQIVVTIVAQ
jgi:hypothetical protein